jgi:hypothetical protein
MQINAAFSSSSLSVIVGENYLLVPVVERVNILVDINLVIYGANGFIFAALTLALASALALDSGVILRFGFFGIVVYIYVHIVVLRQSKAPYVKATEFCGLDC